MKHKKQLRKVNDDSAVIGSDKSADNTANKSLSTGQSHICKFAIIYNIIEIIWIIG